MRRSLLRRGFGDESNDSKICITQNDGALACIDKPVCEQRPERRFAQNVPLAWISASAIRGNLPHVPLIPDCAKAYLGYSLHSTLERGDHSGLPNQSNLSM
jgi:hypothetical protein